MKGYDQVRDDVTAARDEREAKSSAAEATFDLVSRAALRESPLNPRKRFDPQKMEELTASVRAKGVIAPLLVRPMPSSRWEDPATPLYEIGAGHRRFRAATTAGVDRLPALIREMNDIEFLELLVLENDQREDVHPLEEATGYQALMKSAAGYDVAGIAERVGRSVKYVYDRVKLLALTKEAQKVFLEGKITAGHAILLARLKPEDQARALNVEEGQRGARRGGLWQDEHLLWDPDEKDGGEDSLKPVSVRELQAWIDEHVRFDPTAADLPELFPETATTVTRAQEQEEKIVPITHEHYIQAEAREGRTLGPRSWKRADGRQKSKPCDQAITGVIVVGPGRGEAFKVCTDKERCKTHWGAERRERAKRAASTSTQSRGGSSQDRWEREDEKRKAEETRRQAERARWTKALPKILEALAAAVKKAPTRAGGLLGEILIAGCADDYTDKGGKKAAAYVPRGTTADDLIRHAAFICLYIDAVRPSNSQETFPKRAKAFGLDVRKLVDEAAPKTVAETPEPPTKKPVQTAAKKKATR
jgi:ParB family chromosome partitioning protein